MDYDGVLCPRQQIQTFVIAPPRKVISISSRYSTKIVPHSSIVNTYTTTRECSIKYQPLYNFLVMIVNSGAQGGIDVPVLFSVLTLTDKPFQCRIETDIMYLICEQKWFVHENYIVVYLRYLLKKICRPVLLYKTRPIRCN